MEFQIFVFYMSYAGMPLDEAEQLATFFARSDTRKIAVNGCYHFARGVWFSIRKSHGNKYTMIHPLQFNKFADLMMKGRN